MLPTVLSILMICLYNVSCQTSEFNLDGDYLIGGLFPVHYAADSGQQRRPAAVKCSEKPFFLTGYHLLQVMRFAVDEINNFTSLLPNVSLGYHLFDHCSSTRTFPSSLHFFSSHNGSIKAKKNYNRHLPKIIGFTGPLSSAESETLAPLFMMDLVPMISYGASSSVLSEKLVYPSFLRTVPSNKEQIELIIHIIKHFGWNWVAFIGSTSTYSQDAFQLFNDLIASTGICMAYSELITDVSLLNNTFKSIDMLNVKVIVLFLADLKAMEVITSAIQLQFQDKVWIAGEAWSMYQPVTKLQGIETIGTIIGVTPRTVSLPGFTDFIHQSRAEGQKSCYTETGLAGQAVCNQDCEACPSQSAEGIINEASPYSFSVYSAVYTMAMALHNALQCNNSGCNTSRTVYPYMFLREIKRLPVFPLNQLNVSFNEKGDPPAHYSIVFWDTRNQTVKIQKIGTYENRPVLSLSIDDTQIHWHGNGLVPFSNCSLGCMPGYIRQQDGQHQCCFTCMECPVNQYANHTADLCLPCGEYEWSEPASTSCEKRSVEYLHFSDVLSILTLLCASSLILLCLGVAVLFAIHRSTPVVRSAGGSMCFLMLGCLVGACISIFFFFGEPSAVNCVLRNIPYTFFHTVCLSCLFVRSFQIICVFKMAAHLPKAYALWMKYNGQWLVVTGVSFLQLFLCILWIVIGSPTPNSDTQSFKDQVVLSCFLRSFVPITSSVTFMCSLSGVCFLLSYMGKDLPKNYNEAKAITFCILLFFLSWVAFVAAYVLSRSKYVQLINALVQLSSSYGILFSYFLPKSFIIVFQPMKNTQEYFQASIQSYTQTISRT